MTCRWLILTLLPTLAACTAQEAEIIPVIPSLSPVTVQQAKAGDAAAQFTLADYYRATAQPEKMLHWLQLSADQGYPLAQTSLGVITLNGDGVPPDRAAAYLWFGRAADQNDSDAMKFANDIDLELSEEQAQQLITESANP